MGNQIHEPTEEEFKELDQDIKDAVRGKCLFCASDLPNWKDENLEEHEYAFVTIWAKSVDDYGDIDHFNNAFYALLHWIFDRGHFLDDIQKLTDDFCPKCIQAAKSVYYTYLQKMPYRDYLKTPYWQMTRNRKLKSARNRCQLCNSKKHLNVHHRTYERRGHEDDEDLIVLCGHCHAKFHDKLPEGE